MTANLYDVLGVDKQADTAAIRKAYRSKAKSAHPDGGGSAESFDLVRLAHDCLSDAERRRRYDESGQVDPTSADNEAAMVMNVAIGAVNAVMASIHQRNGEWGKFDILGDATRHIEGQIEQVNIKIREADRNAKKLRAVALRFKAKAGKMNKLGPMIDAQAAEQERNIATMQRDKAKLDAARTMLKEHDFEFEKQADRGSPYGVCGAWMNYGA